MLFVANDTIPVQTVYFSLYKQVNNVGRKVKAMSKATWQWKFTNKTLRGYFNAKCYVPMDANAAPVHFRTGIHGLLEVIGIYCLKGTELSDQQVA